MNVPPKPCFTCEIEHFKCFYCHHTARLSGDQGKYKKVCITIAVQPAVEEAVLSSILWYCLGVAWLMRFTEGVSFCFLQILHDPFSLRTGCNACNECM